MDEQNLIILDLEWNQGYKKADPGQLQMEIIEFGAVKVDGTGQIIDQFEALVKPCVYEEMHFKIYEVTGLTMQILAGGEPFAAVCERFFSWCGKDPVFATWGDMDLSELQKNMAYFGVKKELPWPFLYYDLQKLFCRQFEEGRSKIALEAAVKKLGIPEDEPYHRAVYDARYTARVFSHLNWDMLKVYWSVDYYRIPEKRAEELVFSFPDYTKYVSRRFANRDAALRDLKVISTACMRCSRPLIKKIRWFSANGKVYSACGYCPEHGWMKGKLRIKKHHKEGYFAVKTQKATTAEKAEQLRVRKRTIREKRLAKALKRSNGGDAE